ncbi:DEAD/DEAH box helicase [Plantactinospora sp. WMMB334]|uniref:DEAD/DEAH box helicase n=1 Tax=Plantactinospora sp. WMMB334 TaxID=3404119 RepID=UPI003B9538FB
MTEKKSGAGAPPPTAATAEPPGHHSAGLSQQYRQESLIGTRPPGGSPFSLRPYQREAIEAIREAYVRGVRRPLIAIPTGGGKTIIFSGLIRRRATNGRRVLVIAHREELLTQAAKKIELVAPDLNVGIVKGVRNEHRDVDVVVASIQTICRPNRLAEIGRFDTIVVDEAHHAPADTYMDTLRALGSFDPDTSILTVGVTATAGERSDGVGLRSVWQEIVYQRGILFMIANGYLVDVKALEIESDLDLSRVEKRNGDYSDGSLGAELDSSGAIAAAAEGYGKYARDRRGVAFTPTVQNAHQLAAYLNGLGIRAEALSGETPGDERRAILDRVHRGETQVVANCGVLTEGYDEPALSCALIARPTKSRPLFVQMAGRVLRKHPAKENALILTLFAPPAAGLASIADLAGDDAGRVKPQKDETLAEAADRALLEEQAFGGRVPIRSLSAKHVRLFADSRLRWLPVGNGFSLPAKNSTLLLIPQDDDRWRVVEVPSIGEPTEVASGLSLELGQGLGEEFARARGGAISRADARWRAQEVSDRQKRRLARLRLSVPATSGEASDAIAVAEAEQAMRRLVVVA